jgi:mono/diheme cytochrome c family protein
MVRRLVVFAAALVALGSGAACSSGSTGPADGAAVFGQVCSRCHGPAGVPDEGNVARLGVKPLNSAHVREQLSDADIRRQILNGSRNKQMPSFAGALDEDQISAVVAHVRRLPPG